MDVVSIANVTVRTRVSQDWKDELASRAKANGTDLGGLMRSLVADYLGKEDGGDRLSHLERRVSVMEGKLRKMDK